MGVMALGAYSTERPLGNTSRYFFFYTANYVEHKNVFLIYIYTQNFIDEPKETKQFKSRGDGRSCARKASPHPAVQK